MPHKTPRKSHKTQNPEVSAEQKAMNKVLSQVHIVVEQAIGGMTRDTIVVHGVRNRQENFEDDVIGVCAGLWNLVLSY
jgi:DDE superfamily endonuclease